MKTLDKIIGKIERFIENRYIQSIYEGCNKMNLTPSREDYGSLKYKKN